MNLAYQPLSLSGVLIISVLMFLGSFINLGCLYLGNDGFVAIYDGLMMV
jgi:hypothetical protein